MDKSDPLDPALNRMIVESIHNDVMKAMASRGKIVYDMAPEDLDGLFEMIAFNIKERVARHFKGVPPDTLKGHFKAVESRPGEAAGASLSSVIGHRQSCLSANPKVLLTAQTLESPTPCVSVPWLPVRDFAQEPQGSTL